MANNGLTNQSTKINLGGGGRGGGRPNSGGAALPKGGNPAPTRPAHTSVPTRPKVPGNAGAQAKKATAGGNIFSALPKALQPQSAKQMRQQATKTIKTSYAPQYQQLNQQQQFASGIYSQQQSDNEFFQQWLSAQGNAATAHADAANAALNAQQQALMKSQQDLFSGQATNLEDQANANAGNVSNNANATEFGGQLQANQQAMGMQLNASAEQANAAQQTGNAQNVAMGGIASGVLGTERQKELAALDTTLTSVADTRAKVMTAETGDIQKEIARLQGVNISKAQYATTLAATEQKLNLTKAEDQSLITSRTNATKLNQEKLGVTTADDAAKIKQANANFKLNEQKFGFAVAKDKRQQELGTGPYRVSKTGVKSTPYGKTATGEAALSPASQRVYYNTLNTVAEAFRQDINKYHGGVVNATTLSYAWHDFASGRVYPDGARGYGGMNKTSVLNLIMNSLTPQGITQGDRRYLASIGLTGIEQHYTVRGAAGSGSTVSNAGHGTVA